MKRAALVLAGGVAALGMVAALARAAPASAPRGAGPTLVFANDRDGDDDLYAVDARGGRVVALTRNDEDDTLVDVSRDGRRLIVDNDRSGFSLLSLDRPGRQWKLDGPGAFSPDGRTVAITRNPDDERKSRIVLVAADGGTARDLGPGGFVSFSPNGRLILYEDATGSSLGLLDARTGRRRRIASSGSLAGALDLGWSPSGRWHAWRVYAEPSGSVLPDGLVVVDADAAAPRARTILEAPNLAGTWTVHDRLGVSSSADLIAFRVLDPGGAATAPVRHAFADVSAFSRNGRWVAYETKNLDGHPDLVLLTLATGATRVIAHRAGNVDWSPDGSRLAAQAAGHVVVFDPARGTTTTVGVSRNASGYLWSRDGRTVAWSDEGATYGAAVLEQGGARRLGFAAGTTQIEAWLPRPLPARFPTAAPPPPAEVAPSARELQTAGPALEVASSGPRAAVLVGPSRTDCTHVVVWTPAIRSIRRLDPPSPCRGSSPEWVDLSLVGTAVTWTSYSAGNFVYRSTCRADVRKRGYACGDELAIWDPGDDVDDEGNLVPNPYPDRRPKPPPAEVRRGVRESLSNGTIVLRRLADGRTRRLRPPGGAIDAELEDGGLFYACNARAGKGPGRVVFVPFARLFAR